MSGGSFGYLYSKSSPEDLGNNYGLIHKMAEALEQFGPEAKSAALETRKIIALLDEAFERAQDVAREWQAIELYCSGDWSREQAAKAFPDKVELLPEELSF